MLTRKSLIKMKTSINFPLLYSLLFVVFALNTAQAQFPKPDWVNTIGDIGAGIHDVQDIVFDNSGNAYAIGNFEATSDFNTGGVISHTSAGLADVFIAKYTATGVISWVTRFGGSGFEKGVAIALENGTNNVFITGAFGSGGGSNFAMHTGGAPIITGPTLLASGGLSDIFVAKLASIDGDVIWAGGYGNNNLIEGTSLTALSGGELYLGGYYYGSAFKLGAPPAISSAGAADGFIASLNPSSGNCNWIESMGGSANDKVNAISVEPGFPGIRIIGDFESSDFTAQSANLNTNGASDIFVAEYNQSGILNWIESMGGSNFDHGYSITHNNTGELLITGEFEGMVDFELGPGGGGPILTSIGNSDAFVAKYPPSGGIPVWVNQLGGSSSTANGWSIAAIDNKVFLSGSYNGTIDLDPSAATYILNPTGGQDAFAAKYNDADGSFAWGFSLGSTGQDNGYAIAATSSGNNFAIGGDFDNTIDFDPNVAVLSRSPSGSKDGFVARYCDPPIVTAITTSSNPICAGDIITIDNLNNGSAPLNYIWSNGNTNSSFNEIAVGSGISTTVTYVVTMTDGTGCSNTSSVDVIVNDVVAGGFRETICAGNSANLGPPTSGDQFVWSTGATTGSITVTPSMSTEYTVTITNSGTGCSQVFSDSVIVDQPFTIAPSTTSPSSQACPNETFTVDANCSGNCAGVSYIWDNGEATENFITAEANNTGFCSTYNVTATSSGGCSATGFAPFCIAASPSPNFFVNPSSSICLGTSLNFSASCVTCGSPSYTWARSNGAIISSTSAATHTPSAVGNTFYILTVTDGGCPSIDTIPITVTPSPTANISVSPNDTICEGETVTLSATCGSCSSPSYSWESDIGFLGTTPSVSRAPLSGNRYFYVTITENGCSAADNINVFVKPSPTASISVSPSTTVCEGTTVNVSNFCGTCTAPNYSWSYGTPPNLLFLFGSAPSHTVTNSGKYYLNIEDNGCTIVDSSITMTVLPNPTVSIPSLSTVCTNSSITVTPTYSGGNMPYTYLWNNGNTTISKTMTAPAAASNIIHKVTVTDANNCTNTDSTVQPVVDCGSVSLAYSLAPNPPFFAVAEHYCYNAFTQISVNGAPAGATYLWNTGETTQYIGVTLTQDTSFSVTVSFGGSVISTLNTGPINVYPAPGSFTLTLIDSVLCNGDDALIQIDYNGSPSNWLNNVSITRLNIDGAGSNSYIIPFSNLPTTQIISGLAGDYGLIPAGTQCISSTNFYYSNIVTITESNISPNITAVPTGPLCEGDSVSLIASGNCAGGCDYLWNTSATDNYISTFAGGTYTVSITESSTGCTADTSININQINNVIGGFNLGAPMQTSEPPRNLVTLVTYNPIGTSRPATDMFSGSGVSGTDFDPSIAGVGNHIITYSYTDNGCTFSIADTILVSDTSTTVVYNNLNPASGTYSSSEVCVGDSLEVTFSIPDPGVGCGAVTLHFNDGQGGTIVGAAGITTCYVSNGNLIITTQAVVPNGAKTGIVKAFVPTIPDTTNLTAIIVNNPTVQLIGTKNPLCSNDSASIIAIPAGGVLSTYYLSGPTSSSPLVGNTVYGNLVSPFVNGTRDLAIQYSYTPKYGNGAGNFCASPIVVDSMTTVHNIELNNIVFFDVAVSETNVSIDSLINYVLPDTARNFGETFGGLGITGVGPYNFNPNTVGVGTHPISYQISNGVGCSNNINATINVIDAPLWLGLNTQYCNNANNDTLERDPAYVYNVSTPPGFHITQNEIEIIASNYPGGTLPLLTPTPPNPNNYKYLFDPTLVTGAFSVITINYRYTKRSGGSTGPIVHSYIKGSVSDTIFIGSGTTVQFLDIDSVYCEKNSYQRILVSPAGGQLLITGGSSNIVETPNSLGEIYINPFLIHQSEPSTTTYTFTYQYGLTGCSNSVDTQVIIPAPANANFSTLSGNTSRQYCKSDPVDSLIAVNPNGAFTIDGFPVANRFNPAVLSAGVHLVRYTIPNNYGCLSERVDTFRINALPLINFDTVLAATYCEYNSPITITANKIPNPPVTTSNWTLSTIGGTTVATVANNNQFILTPSTFDTDTLPDSIQVSYTYTDAKGCIGSRSSNVIINPRPNINITNLEPVYCINNAAVGLNPTPSGGTFASSLGVSSTNFNTTTGVYNPISTVNQEFISYIYASPTTGCIDTILDTTSVISVSQTVNITSGLPPSYCFVGDTLSITASPAPGAGESATFTSSAISSNKGIVDIQGTTASFVPNQASPGNIIVTYVFTTTSGCAKTASDTILIRPLPKLTMQVGNSVPGLDTICRYSDVEPVNILNHGNYLPIGAPNLSVLGTGISGQYFYADSVYEGTYLVSMSYTDVNGCSNTAIDSIVVLQNDYPYVSGLNNLYCQNASLDTIYASPDGGIWTPNAQYLQTPGGQPYAVFDPNYYYNNLGPGQDSISYTYTYINGCSNTTVNRFAVVSTPNIAIVSPTQSSICTGDSLVLLQATLNGSIIPTDTIGSFFVLDPALAPAPAAIVNDSMFDPSVGTGVYTISYAFNDASSGCSDTVSQNMTINPSPQFNMVGFKQNYCIGDEPDTIGITGVTGLSSITYSITGDTGVYSISGTNNAFIHPDSIGVNTNQPDTLQVTVFNGCYTTNEYEVTVSGLPTGLYLAGVDPYYCSNTSKDIVSGYPNGGLSSGFMVYDSLDVLVDSSINDQISLRPINYNLGEYKVVYRYQDPFACASEDSAFFEVHPAPVASYQQLRFCKGETIQIENQSFFQNTLNASDTLQSWKWIYKGLSFGNGQDDTLELFNEQPGWGHITLEVISGAGCRDTLSSSFDNGSGLRGDTVFVYTIPTANFITIGGCEDREIKFIPGDMNITPTFLGVPLDQVSQARWVFDDGQDSIINNPGTILDTVTHRYSQAGVYYPKLVINNNANCGTNDSVRLVISPRIQPYPTAYSQDFESANDDWNQSVHGTDSLWQWGVANGDWISTVGDTKHNKLWVTALDTFYPPGAASWVYSPCFDFSNSLRPMIKMDFMADIYDSDGAVLEYYVDSSDTWQTVGEQDQGINWYNNAGVVGFINFKPLGAGVSLEGWSGVKGQWNTARYRLDAFKGKNDVRFRIAFGSLSGVTGEWDGFGFDNVWVGERTHNVLIEHFANVNHLNMNKINKGLYDLVLNPHNGLDVYFIQYHTDRTSPDPINLDNSGDHNSRRFYYGVENGETLIDGGEIYKGLTKNITQEMLDYSMLQDPVFQIDDIVLNIDVPANEISVSTNVIAQQDLPQLQYAIRTVIVEDSLVRTTSDVFQKQLLLHSVMRKMLPNHSGVLKNQGWTTGQMEPIQEIWTGVDFVKHNKNHLSAAVFIQDNNGNSGAYEVYQVKTSRDINYLNTIAVEETEEADVLKELFSAKVYPNPAMDEFTLGFSKALQQDYEWQLVDMRGVRLQHGAIQKGEEQLQILSYDLPAGMYLINVYNQDESIWIQRKVVIVRP